MSVYFYHLKDSNKVKIGCSSNVLQRIKQLNTGIHEQCTLIRVIENCDFEAEKWLHKYFKDFRIKGEWFNYTEEMLTIKLPENVCSDYLKYKHLALSEGYIIPNGGYIIIIGDTYEERLNYIKSNIKQLKRFLS